ncbi:MAG: patatin-like phospholipase family protein [Erysipelotrichaceae bacterium]|nr:patatin-like phospholipase family protein [Erysipelotrichaceae bacterium]
MKVGLVLGGGGSKGAYEVGVWKALRELNIQFDIVTGTSIGAMIGAMIVQDDFEKCESLWNGIEIEDVIENGVNLNFDIKSILAQKKSYTKFVENLCSSRRDDILPFIKIVNHMFDEDKFFNSAIDFGCMTINVTKRKPQAFQKAQLSTAKEVKNVLIASAACFPMFPMKKIDDENFIDGGYYDNVPIQLARELGADIIIAVDLKSVGTNRIDEPQADVIYIEPHVPLGSFFCFHQEIIQRNKLIGYLDTMKKFQYYYGYIYTFHFQSKNNILQYENAFQSILHHFHINYDDSKYIRLLTKVCLSKIKLIISHYEDYTYQYLYLLEQVAILFDIEYLHIYDFNEFKQKVVTLMKKLTFSNTKEEKRNLKLVLHKLKRLSHKEMIYYLYMMVREDPYDTRLLPYIVAFTEDYLKALAIYLCEI